MQRILIRGLTLFGHHGAYLKERERGQVFVVDACLDLERPSRRDELGETVDYTTVIQALRGLNEVHQFQLIESLAQALAESLIERFPRIQKARVRVRKRLPTSNADLEWVAAEAVCVREGNPIGE